MLHSRYIVVEDFPDDSTRVVYNGASSIEAQKAMGKSIHEAKADAVIFFSHPISSQVRYPAREKLEIAERAEHAKKAISAEAVTRQQQAALKRANAARLVAEADALEGNPRSAAAAATPESEAETEDLPESGDEKSPSASASKKTKKKNRE